MESGIHLGLQNHRKIGRKEGKAEGFLSGFTRSGLRTSGSFSILLLFSKVTINGSAIGRAWDSANAPD